VSAPLIGIALRVAKHEENCMRMRGGIQVSDHRPTESRTTTIPWVLEAARTNITCCTPYQQPAATVAVPLFRQGVLQDYLPSVYISVPRKEH
jgi:hypothetical protein